MIRRNHFTVRFAILAILVAGIIGVFGINASPTRAQISPLPQNGISLPPLGVSGAGGGADTASPTRPRPVAQSQEMDEEEYGTPPVHSAAFFGVTVGITTEPELFQKWGNPRKTSKDTGGSAYLFTLEGFNHIEVLTAAGKVVSVAIVLDEPMPASQVRDALAAELQKTRPITISDGNGDVLGQVFPEKGVNLVFTPSERNGVPSQMVTRIAIEPISAEPFVLRAEGYVADSPQQSKRDVTSAIQIEPTNAQAHWLLAQILLKEGNTEDAVAACEKALTLNEDEPMYHVTMAQILAQYNRVDKAKQYLEELIPALQGFDFVQGIANNLLGDLYVTGTAPKFDKAIACHQKAIEILTPLCSDANPSLRLKAKDALVTAHIGAARDVALGGWENRQTATYKWLSRAKELANDPELNLRKPGTKDIALRLAICELSLQSGMPETAAIEPLVAQVTTECRALVNGTADDIQKMKYLWDSGLAIYGAGQVFQGRKQYPMALKYCELASQFLDEAMKTRTSNPQDVYLIGQMFFRIGTIHALGMKDTASAVQWYNRSQPLLIRSSEQISTDEAGKLGESFIIMSVSYWETNQKPLSLQLSLRGVQLMEKAVADKKLAVTSLKTPYENIATMYRQLNQQDEANRYTELARQAVSSTGAAVPLR